MILLLLLIIPGDILGFKPCDKLIVKGDNKGVVFDYNQYFIELKNTESYKRDAEYLIGLVEQYQTTQEACASDVKSELKLSETRVGVLSGTSSQHALTLVSTV